MSAHESDLAPVDILLVDDHPDNLLSLKALLVRPDYNLVMARSGQEALAHVLRRELALILLDVAMPIMDGFETASTIKEREQSKLIPIIFITASVYDMEHIFRGYTVGAVDYLRKPIDPHSLRSKVAVFVELYRQRKQIERQAARLREAELREQTLLRERVEEALRESESLYQLTYDQAPIGIGYASAEGRWIRANRRLCEILGGEAAALVGQPMAEMAVGEERTAIEHRLDRLRAGEMHYAGEHQLRQRQGTSRWVELTLTALHDPAAGQVREFLAVVDDISARKRAELERSRLVRDLQEGIRSRDDFLSLAAHELRTPVTPLLLQTENVLRELERRPAHLAEPGRFQRRLATIRDSAVRLGTLIDRLLDVSRLNVGSVSLELEAVDLAIAVREVVGRLRLPAEQAGCTVTVHEAGPAVGQWDFLRVDQIISNLLSNAIKYGAGKPIELEVSADQSFGRLSVRDHGVGIPAEAQERIFERFERAEPVRHYGGFGLGLWIVRRLVDAHGGHIQVRSQPGQGAEFSIELPLRPVVQPGGERGPPPAEAHA